MNYEKCALIGYTLKPEEIKPIIGTTLEYETEFVGKVKITFPAYIELVNGDWERYIIAGICKKRTLENYEPILIDSNFIRKGYKELNPPYTFEEKCVYFLKYIYENGGADNKEFEFNSSKDFPLAFASPEEFERIVDQLEQDHSLNIRKTHNLANRAKIFMGVKITISGKEKAKKGLPKMPLYGLVSQEITTDDAAVDSKINHARTLFFSDPQTLDNMRSACEALCFVLEPLRTDLANYFTQRDVSDFFQLVNTFDIRHNKETTKNLIYPEQLEWIFYTLLNTINTYTKLKKRWK